MSVPVFINLEANNQLDEVLSYICSKGIKVECGQVEYEEKLNQIIKASEALWNEAGIEYELELVFNSIISMVVLMMMEYMRPQCNNLCAILSKPHPPPDKRNASKMKLLSNLFAGLETTSPLRYTVYSSLISLAGQAELLHLIHIRLGEIKEWVREWGVGASKHQQLLSNIHQAYLANKQVDKASRVMIELLCTYTKENAALATDDARRCIVGCIADPGILLMEHLRLCEPVKFLEGEAIHDLLLLFVSGRLKDYMAFEQQHPDVISNNKLSHQDNINKMRLLTFCSMADNNKTELKFDDLKEELMLKEEELEPFLAEVLKSKVAQIRIEQPKRKVQVHSSVSRTFGTQQWMKLYGQLESWRASLDTMTTTLKKVMAVAAN